MGYKGLIPTPADSNHTSAFQHPSDVATYVMTELEQGAMLGLYEDLPFVPWFKVNIQLVWLKKDSHLRRIIMELSWPHIPWALV